ncbi:MAG: class I SAM-dependent methyltransferase, partial [Patescibacteria group bacterium]
NNYNIYRCQECGLIFVWPIPKNTGGLYSKDYFKGAALGYGYVDYEKDKAAMKKTFNVYLDKVEKILPTKGRLLDVGSALGSFLQLASRRWWQVSGVEISDYAAKHTRDCGLDVICGTTKDLLSKSGFFDALTYLDVFEHLSDPKAELAAAHQLLKSGGLLIINTPDTNSVFSLILGKNWHLLTPPEHLFVFNRNNLTKMLESCGFEILSVCHIGKKFTLQYIIQTLYNWQKIFIWRWLTEIFKNNFLGRISLPVNLRDNMFIIAKKV